MKLVGIAGKGSGRVGSMVYAVRGGVQIVRQYNPIVANPSTQAQVAVRSKLKLMSQLASAAAPVIAIKSEGLKSARNMFVKQNYSEATYGNNIASIALDKLQLTKSNVAFPDIIASRDGNGVVSVHLNESAGEQVHRVIYCAFKKQDGGNMQLVASKQVLNDGTNPTFSDTLVTSDDSLVILGYGVRLNSDKAQAVFANVDTPVDAFVAQLRTALKDDAADITLTQTMGTQMNEGSNSGTVTPSGNVRITLTGYPAAGGEYTGGGTYAFGDSVTINAVDNEGYDFLGWYNGQTLVTNQRSYTFTATESMGLTAKWESTGPGED